MKFLVVGCGSIGKRHIKNLLSLNQEVIGFDISSRAREETEKKFSIQTFSDLDIALEEKLDAVFICNPNSEHISSAIKSAKKGLHLFIEKPLSHTLDGVEELIELTEKNKLITLVGCNMRFHEGIKKIKDLLDNNTIGKVLFARVQSGSYLPDWHPWADYRKGYSANKSLGGGVLLDGIHEIDYLRGFFGDVHKVSCFADKISSLEINTEDVAEILLRFTNGIIAEVHLDYVQRAYARTCQIVGQEGTILWDFNEPIVKVYLAKNKKWNVIKLSPYDDNKMYVEEIKHFINCINGKEKPYQDVIEGKKALEIVLAAKESSKTNKTIILKR